MFFKSKMLYVAMLLMSFIALAGDGKYENLKVLPKDTDKQTMSKIMRQFTKDLGVRCYFCHVGEAGKPLSTYDFASDDKTEKIITRQMMEMVNDLNGRHLKDLGRPGHNETASCYTCHRGVPEPKTLAQVLNKQLKRKGADAAVEKYRKLRERHYGASAYDFTEESLLDYAESLAKSKKYDEAFKFLNLNLEFFPKSGWTHYTFGEVHNMKGDKEKALASMNKAAEILPNEGYIKKRIAEITAK